MIDPRSPRFGAGVTAVLLLVTIALALATPPSGADVLARATNPAVLLLTAISLLFLWGAAAGIRRHPYGWLYRTLIRPRLSPPAELEDPKPPTFAQLVGFIVTAAGIALTLAGIPAAVAVAAALAFVAAFLNAVFGYCIGCQLYLLVARLRPQRSAA